MMMVIKRKAVFAGIAIFLAVIITAFVLIEVNTVSYGAPSLGFKVVIDAGHGGYDGGVVGYNTGVKEAELNLELAKELEKYFRSIGIDVVMTRKNSDGLYSLGTKNKKQQDMKARAKIIEEAEPDVVISIHMNAFVQRKQRGAQVFFKKGNQAGMNFAQSVKSVLGANLEYGNREALAGDYYILNCTDRPAVLVECGFLSNEQEELLLKDKDYRQKVAYYIMLGTLKYLGADFHHLNLA